MYTNILFEKYSANYPLERNMHIHISVKKDKYLINIHPINTFQCTILYVTTISY